MAVEGTELILVVERGSGSVSVLDGSNLRELDRFAVGRVHGGIKFDRGFHQALVATRDGTLVDYDLDRGAVRTRVKVGVNTRNIAISGDGKYVAAANQLPQGLVVLDGRLHPLATLPLLAAVVAIALLSAGEALATLNLTNDVSCANSGGSSGGCIPIFDPLGSGFQYVSGGTLRSRPSTGGVGSAGGR